MPQTKAVESDCTPEEWRRVAAKRLRGLFADTAPSRSLADELIDCHGRVGVTIAGIAFDHAEYDADADVLYLHVGDPSRAVDYDETPEGHAVRYDGNGALVGLTLVRPKRLLEQEGELRITVPVPSAVPTAELTPVLRARTTDDKLRFMAHATKTGQSAADRRNAAIERTSGMFAHLAPGVSLADELIADRRAEVRAEEEADQAERRRRAGS